MQCYTVYFIWKLLYMFWVVPPPIIRSTNNCVYSIWYLLHRYCYLPLSWKSWNWFECAHSTAQHRYGCLRSWWWVKVPPKICRAVSRSNKLRNFWRSQVHASSYNSNKSNNEMELFFASLLLDVHMWLNMFRASPRPSSGAYNCTRSLCFYLWKETAGTGSSRFLPKVEPEAPSAVVCSWCWAGRRPKHVEPHMNAE